jgi:hypothetical protein
MRWPSPENGRGGGSSWSTPPGCAAAPGSSGTAWNSCRADRRSRRSPTGGGGRQTMLEPLAQQRDGSLGLLDRVPLVGRHDQSASRLGRAVRDGDVLLLERRARVDHEHRKRIFAPDGSELAPSSKPEPDGTLLKALARAWRWQRMLRRGPVRFRPRPGGSGGGQPLLCQPDAAPDPARTGDRRTDLKRAPGTTSGGADAAVPGRVGAAADPALLSLNMAH